MIERLVIDNYKSIRHAEIDLEPINILIGANGAGKSNLISFLQMLGQMYDKSLQHFVAQSGGIDNLLYGGQKVSSFLQGLIDFDNVNAYQFRLIPAHGNVVLEWEKDYFNGHSCAKNYELWHLKVFNQGSVQESTLRERADINRARHLRQYIQSFQNYHFHDTSREAHIKQPCRTDDNRILRENGSNLAAYLYYLQKKHPASFARIEAIIRSIAPFFDRFDLAPDRINEEYINLVWRERDSPMFLNAHNFSDGTLRMIALTTLLAQPELPQTIIIDEPELGLHPAAIVKLAALLRQASSQSQIIISTQSVNLVNCFEPKNIIVVDRKDKQSIFQRLQINQLQEWLEDYTLGDLWDKNVFGGRP